MYLGIDETYFTKELTIPNLNEIGETLTDLTEYVDQYGRLLLKGALGSVLYTDFDALLVDNDLPSGAPQKWLNLVNGKTYTKDSKTYVWQGLKYTEGSFKSSLIAEFSYYYYLTDKVSEFTGVGLKVVDAKNAIGANSTQKAVTIWNSFLKKYQGRACKDSALTYWIAGTPVIDWLGGRQGDDFVSMLVFLQDNATDYPDAALLHYGVKNQLGI